MLGFLLFEAFRDVLAVSILTVWSTEELATGSRNAASSRSVKGDETRRSRKGDGGSSSLIRFLCVTGGVTGRLLSSVEDDPGLRSTTGLVSDSDRSFIESTLVCLRGGDGRKYFDVVAVQSFGSDLFTRVLRRSILDGSEESPVLVSRARLGSRRG